MRIEPDERTSTRLSWVIVLLLSSASVNAGLRISNNYSIGSEAVGSGGKAVSSSHYSVEGSVGRIGSGSIKRVAPVVFIPGIAGSALTGGDETGRHRDGSGNGEYLWPSIDALDIRALNLRNGVDNVKAVSLIREYEPLYGSVGRKIIYGPFIDFLTSAEQGYHIFDFDEYPSRMTNGFRSSTNGVIPMPSFFPYPYDWRRSNAAHTDELHRYIQNIRELHGGSKVNVVAHSMGGLLIRRYLLDYGTDDIENVVTVGSPLWGAPVATYRMLQGDLFDFLPIDWWNNEAVKAALLTFPSFHELLPSPLYLQNSTSVFSEAGWDFDHDGNSFEDYSSANFHLMIDREANPDIPSANNLAFHNYSGGRQGNWLSDSGGVKFLHVYGDRPQKDTTISVRVVTEYGGDLERPTPYPKFVEIKGRGDKVVPNLSARRPDSYSAPNTIYRSVTTADLSEHTDMMRNPHVLSMIVDFLNDGELTGSPPSLFANQTNALSHGMRRITVRGANYVRVSDALGNENTKINEYAAKKIPGIEIRYGGSQPWMEIDLPAGHELDLDADSTTGSLEIQIVGLDLEGLVETLQRYRFAPTELAWRLELNTSLGATLHIDKNSDGNFDVGELLDPSHDLSGNAVDSESPTVSLQLALSGETITVSLTGEDGEQPTPNLFYSLDSESMQPYATPLEFATGSSRKLKAFAEDAAGNTSGLIETAIQPDLSLDADSGGTVTLTWPMADAYVLEESTSLEEGSWTPSESPITREGFEDRATISTDPATRKFFRLRSRAVTK